MVSNQDIKRMKWCAESQMEKLWDLREKLADALGELLELRQREEWVKVSPESMPKEPGWYLVSDGKRFDVARKLRTSFMGHALQFGDVTHWRLLPAPPKEGL